MAHVSRGVRGKRAKERAEAVARFKVELHEGVAAEVVRLLENASWDRAGTRWEVQVPSMFVRDRILDALARSPLPDPVRAQRGPVWTFADETYQELRRQFGLDPKPPPEWCWIGRSATSSTWSPSCSCSSWDTSLRSSPKQMY